MAEKNYQASKDKYLKEKVDTFVLRVPKGQKDEISLYAKNKGMSLNGYITGLIFEDMGIKSEKPKVNSKKKTTNVNKRPAKKAPQKTIDKKPTERANEKKKESSRNSMPSFLL